jgi:hypothetical protein
MLLMFISCAINLSLDKQIVPLLMLKILRDTITAPFCSIPFNYIILYVILFYSILFYYDALENKRCLY